MFQLKVVFAPAMLLAAGAAVGRAPSTAAHAALSAIVANDNRSAAGSLKNGVL